MEDDTKTSPTSLSLVIQYINDNITSGDIVDVGAIIAYLSSQKGIKGQRTGISRSDNSASEIRYTHLKRGYWFQTVAHIFLSCSGVTE